MLGFLHKGSRGRGHGKAAELEGLESKTKAMID